VWGSPVIEFPLVSFAHGHRLRLITHPSSHASVTARTRESSSRPPAVSAADAAVAAATSARRCPPSLRAGRMSAVGACRSPQEAGAGAHAPAHAAVALASTTPIAARGSTVQ